MIYLMVQFNGLGVVFPLLVLFEAEARLALSYAHRVNGQLLEFYAVDERANTDLPFVGFADVETGSRWNILGRAIDGSLAKPPVEQIPAYNSMWFAWAVYFWLVNCDLERRRPVGKPHRRRCRCRWNTAA
jgi:hypothetical protein